MLVFFVRVYVDLRESLINVSGFITTSESWDIKHSIIIMDDALAPSGGMYLRLRYQIPSVDF